MGFLNNIGRGAVGFATGGLSELGRKDPFGLGGNRSMPGFPGMTKPLTAGDVAIPASLTAALGAVGTNAQKGIDQNYADLGARSKAESGARGIPSKSNSYAPERLNVQHGLDMGALEGALGGVVGNTAYNDALQQREYNQNLSLAEETAALNKPDLLQQILGGVGAIGKPIATYAGMKGRGGKRSAPAEDSYDDYDGDY